MKKLKKQINFFSFLFTLIITFSVSQVLAKNTILDYIPKNKKFHFTDLVKELKKNNKKIGLYTEKKNNWLDVGQWDEFKKTTSFFE